jgi:hypothetical protein
MHLEQRNDGTLVNLRTHNFNLNHLQAIKFLTAPQGLEYKAKLSTPSDVGRDFPQGVLAIAHRRDCNQLRGLHLHRTREALWHIVVG